MPVGQFTGTRANYYSVGDGKIRATSKNDAGEKVIAYHDYLEGFLVSITLKTDTFQGEEINKVMFKLSDADGTEFDILQVGEHSNFARDIINRLVTAMPPAGTFFKDWIRITPYLSEDEVNKKSYTRGSLRVAGEKVKPHFLAADIPAVDKVKVGSKIHTDDTKRTEFFRGLIQQITAHLPAVAHVGVRQATGAELDDMLDEETAEQPASIPAPF